VFNKINDEFGEWGLVLDGGFDDDGVVVGDRGLGI
jgi:hypothetical protein